MGRGDVSVKKLNINITKAQLKSYSVTLEEGKPVISATVELLTEGGKAVTTYTAKTRQYDWESSVAFELPLNAIEPIVKLAKILEQAVVLSCRDSQMALGSGLEEDPIAEADLIVLTIPEATEKKIKVTIVANEDIDDKPIDLSEIPF